MTMCNIIGIGQFRKSVTNCDMLPIHKADQLHNFTVNTKFMTEAFLDVVVHFLLQGIIRSNGSLGDPFYSSHFKACTWPSFHSISPSAVDTLSLSNPQIHTGRLFRKVTLHLNKIFMTFRTGAVWTAGDKLCLINQWSEVNCHALIFRVPKFIFVILMNYWN
jgi:hypothetical protein